MNYKLLVLALVLSVFAGGLSGWFSTQQKFGATVNYTNSLGFSNLYNAIASVAQDNANLSSNLRAIDTFSSSTATFGSLLGSGVASTTITSTTAGTYATGSIGSPVLGDIVLVSVNATSGSAFAQKGVMFSAQVTATDTITVYAQQVATSGVAVWTGGNVSINGLIFSQAGSGYKIPPALVTTTSTSN